MANHQATYPEIQLYIGGRWKSASGQPVINPADETEIGVVPHATRHDLDDALEAAEGGFRLWRATPPAERTRIILKAAQIIRERVDEMAGAMTLEQGKPFDQARLEIIRGCEIIEWDANEGRRIYGRVICPKTACVTPFCVSRSASSPRSRRGISR